MSSKFYLTLGLIGMPLLLFAQLCSLTLSGHVKDTDTGEPLDIVNLYIEESKRGTTTDSIGFFEFKNLCPGTYHLISSHIGCEPKKLFLRLYRDTSFTIYLAHSATQLNSVVVKDKSNRLNTQNNETLSNQDIVDNADDNLSSLLENIVGVNSLKNGSGIAKPVVHGLYGNRLTLLNNGIPQSGQQWGNDHSPEIDPLVANKISVIKGTSALEYLGGNLGSIIIVEPKKIEIEPHLHGRASYFFETNGLNNGLNLQMQKHAPALAWKINGTLKKSGDKKTPDYFLTNTGNQEANLALQLEKSISSDWFVALYASTFNAELGVLRGSHIGNITDLEAALNREIPFFTEPAFSYQIEAPKQKVNHHLLKLTTKYFINNSEWVDITLAGQLNDRKEFDVRRSGRTDTPALSLQQYSLYSELKYQRELKKEWTLKTGLQYNFTDNTNNPETGILPLIPDYLSHESGVFMVVSKSWKNSVINVGLRYDNVIQKVVTISNTLPREIIRYQNSFHNVNNSLGYTYSFSKSHSITANAGYAMRNPAINELYSAGLHQGVSGIEEGDANLDTEKAIKATLEYNANIRSKISFEALLYYQYIKNYIYLNPGDDIRLTIRGAFPVFQYEQTNAEIFGLDLSGRITVAKSWYVDLKYSYIKGNDRVNDISLVNIPSNSLLASLVFQFEKPIKIGKRQLENFEVRISDRQVFQQKNLLPEQDYVLPPNAYNLVAINLSGDLQLQRIRLRLIAKVDNLFNTPYRDYLNRQRYFADDLGINATFGISVKF